LEFAMKQASGPVSAFAHLAGNSAHLMDFHLDSEVTNSSLGGVTGGSVRTVLLSALGVPALPAGSTITITFPSSDAQAASAAEFRGLNADNPLDQVAAATGTTFAVASGFAQQTGQASELLIGAVGVKGQVSTSGLNGSMHNLVHGRRRLHRLVRRRHSQRQPREQERQHSSGVPDRFRRRQL
jgi:hypothetical protein